MARRTRGGASSARGNAACNVDLACISRAGGSFVVLLQQPDPRTWRLPSAPAHPGGALDDVAGALARTCMGRDMAWRTQSGASMEGPHPDGAAVSVGYAVVVPSGTSAPADAVWHKTSNLPHGIASRHRAIVSAAVAHVRALVDQLPIAFRLLPPAFTLGELQEVYELLLGRRLHKASFRRALTAARLVEPINKWRSDGRGRPAQFFRYAPRRRARAARMVRFDLLGS